MSDKPPRVVLHEQLQLLGWDPRSAVYEDRHLGEGRFACSVELELPGGALSGAGEGLGRDEAADAAAERVLAQMDLLDWDVIKADAQPGDALFKLAGYLLSGAQTADARAHWLSEQETDARFEQVFLQMQAAGDPFLARFGPALNRERRATLVEALFWYRFRDRVLREDAREALTDLLRSTGLDP